MGERQQLHDMLEDFDTVMLVTTRRDGRLNARPMHVAKLDPNCDLWFLTHDDEKVKELRANPVAQVVAQDEMRSWLSLTGHVEILEDRGRVAELWKEPYRAWFPGGKEDPAIRVLVFRPDYGEYWDQRGTKKVTYALEVARAYVERRQPRSDSGEHGTVQL
ncbi:MAG TPA: pyridoxamine 5'-phosphate oxidase family protein [Longimicrobiales bacterium]|nr:pyridoxamine 5'-phosphate oxidase family protein [Longimicrobiales bacterium]